MTTSKFSSYGTDNNSLNNVSTGTGAAIAMQDCRQITGFITYNPGSPPTTGVVVAEHADSSSYTGVRGNLGTWTLANIVAGTEDPSFTYPGSLGFVRYRFITPSDQPITARVNGLLG